jgi:hypothetical protein
MVVDRTIREELTMTASCDNGPTISEFHLRELDKFRQLSDHFEIAMARAMDYCAEHNVCPPQWLVAAAASIMIEQIKREKTTKRGCKGSLIAKFRQDFRDLERWDAVKQVREIREKSRRNGKALKAAPESPATDGHKRHHEKQRKWLKQGTFACASKLLVGRDAGVASPFAICKSFRKVEATLKGPVPPAGAWFSEAFLKKLGLQDYSERKPGTNMFGILDLV